MTPTVRSSSGVYAIQRMTSYLKQEIPGGFCFLLLCPRTHLCPHSFGGGEQAVALSGQNLRGNLLVGVSSQNGSLERPFCLGVSGVESQDQTMTDIVSTHWFISRLESWEHASGLGSRLLMLWSQ